MRVLDIDLDFFLEDCCPLAAFGERPACAGHEPWPEERVTVFLESHCGLRREHPLPGAVFETHDQALVYWEDKRKKGQLIAPYRVTHVDAHSDLGIGYPGPGYVLYNVLAMPPEKRTDLCFFYDQHKLDEANYLLFALAARLVSELDNIRNPKSKPDIPKELLTENGDIRMRSITAQMFEKRYGAEPVVPFHVETDWRSFHADTPFDFVTLAMSPRYAPREADQLKEVIGRYILTDERSR